METFDVAYNIIGGGEEGDKTSVFTCKGGCDYEIVFGVTPPSVADPPRFPSL